MKNKRGALSAPLSFSERSDYLLDPACISSLDSPICSAYFLPWKRAPARVRFPLSPLFRMAALLGAGALRSTTFAGTFASTFFPCES